MPCALTLSINHHHRPAGSSSHVVEGKHGAAMIKLGLLLDYPTGPASPMELWLPARGLGAACRSAGRGSPTAFIGPMANLQRFAAGEDSVLETGVDDAMAHDGAGRGLLHVERERWDADTRDVV